MAPASRTPTKRHPTHFRIRIHTYIYTYIYIYTHPYTKRRFVLKQINDKELAMFLDAAPAYFEHLARVSVCVWTGKGKETQGDTHTRTPTEEIFLGRFLRLDIRML